MDKGYRVPYVYEAEETSLEEDDEKEEEWKV